MAFFAGYWQNYKNLLAHVSGAAYPLAKAFAQVSDLPGVADDLSRL